MVKQIVQQPLTSSFMLVAMLGFFVSIFHIWNVSKQWGFAFAFLFAVFFIASVVNFTHAPDEDTLSVHEPNKHLKHLKVYQKR